MNSLLGFHSKLYTSGFNESENKLNILIINGILVNIGIILGSYLNDSTQPTIYSFFPNVSPGSKIIENPHNLLYLPITAETDGRGLYLGTANGKGFETVGNGLYLMKQGGLYDGSGLI